MGEIKPQEIAEGPYAHLIQRLSVALDEADEMQVVTERPQMELELRGLTAAELKLIQAYLDRDIEQLSGWHAVEQEAQSQEQLHLGAGFGGGAEQPPMSGFGPQAPGALTLWLYCAVCGQGRDWQKKSAVQVCQGCGSQLFRAQSHLCGQTAGFAAD